MIKTRQSRRIERRWVGILSDGKEGEDKCEERVSADSEGDKRQALRPQGRRRPGINCKDLPEGPCLNQPSVALASAPGELAQCYNWFKFVADENLAKTCSIEQWHSSASQIYRHYCRNVPFAGFDALLNTAIKM